jgi:hypothetical protein
MKAKDKSIITRIHAIKSYGTVAEAIHIHSKPQCFVLQQYVYLQAEKDLYRL